MPLQAVAADLNAITRVNLRQMLHRLLLMLSDPQGPLSDHVYDLLVEAYQLIPVATVRGLTLACLGTMARSLQKLR